jgi:adenylosuccinate synthase
VYKLHLVPSGILHERVTCVLGNGTVINPVNLVSEIEHLIAEGVNVTPERLAISTKAHIITPAHVALDRATEKARGKEAIGTTLRGIGPAYMDKTGRTGVRAGLMADPELFAEALYGQIDRTNTRLVEHDMEPLDPREAALAYVEAAAKLKPFLRDTPLYLNERLKQGARVLCEGAQGTMLDIDHGDYPFVTSSSPTAGGALIGLGFGPLYVDRVIGVCKSYATRVGAGPMPTELDDELGARLRGTGENFWDEFGTTTGRPRRTGWLDMVMLRYASAVNGFTELVLTKLDILSGLDELCVAVAYEIDGQRVEFPPATLEDQARAKPVYQTFAGWTEDLGGARGWADLPETARAYIDGVGALVGVPVNTVSVGPEREQLVHRG